MPIRSGRSPSLSLQTEPDYQNCEILHLNIVQTFYIAYYRHEVRTTASAGHLLCGRDQSPAKKLRGRVSLMLSFSGDVNKNCTESSVKLTVAFGPNRTIGSLASSLTFKSCSSFRMATSSRSSAPGMQERSASSVKEIEPAASSARIRCRRTSAIARMIGKISLSDMLHQTQSFVVVLSASLRRALFSIYTSESLCHLDERIVRKFGRIVFSSAFASSLTSWRHPSPCAWATSPELPCD